MANKTGTNLANKLTGTAAADRLFGLGGNDQLFGLAGNDTLDGGTGNDTMTGGAGNDFYKVDSLTDKIVETSTGGIDTVSASITYSLATVQNKFVENLTLTGTALNGTGNDLGNKIVGNIKNNKLSGGKGNDTLDGGTGNDSLSGGDGNDSMQGGAGADTLVGGAGNDVYVNPTGDKITDTAGVDTVQSSGTFSLAAFGTIENLTLTGATVINGTGNGL